MKLATGCTVIANGQLVDGTGSPPVKDAAVVVQDGKIAYAGPAVRVPEVPPDARRIDANGGTILPSFTTTAASLTGGDPVPSTSCPLAMAVYPVASFMGAIPGS